MADVAVDGEGLGLAVALAVEAVAAGVGDVTSAVDGPLEVWPHDASTKPRTTTPTPACLTSA